MSDVGTESGSGYRIGLPQTRQKAKSFSQGESPTAVRKASVATRWVYALALLSLAVWMGSTGWASLAVGRGALPFAIPFVVALAFILWRAAQVLLNPRTLDAPVATGMTHWLRIPGLVLTAAGPIAVALLFLIRPLGRALAPHGSDNGIEFFIVGLGITLLAALAPIGLLLFEFSRLRAFEQGLRENER